MESESFLYILILLIIVQIGISVHTINKMPCQSDDHYIAAAMIAEAEMKKTQK